MRDVSLSAQKFDDFPEERAAPKRRASGPARAPKSNEGRGPVKKRRLGAMTLFAIGGLALIGVPMNALFFQDGRHPAPLFSAHVLVPEKPAPAEAPTPPVRPKVETARMEADTPKADAAPKARSEAKIDPLAEILKADAAPPAKAGKVEKVEKVEKKREVVASRDQIGALLGGGAAKTAAPTPPAPVATAPAGAAAGPDRNVLSAQRALQRLGYVVKPDGVMSPGLKKTIERFERDNGLPVSGELNAKVTKALAARAAAPHP